MKKFLKVMGMILLLAVFTCGGVIVGSYVTFIESEKLEISYETVTYAEFAKYVDSMGVNNKLTSYHYELTQGGYSSETNLTAEIKVKADVKYIGEKASVYCEISMKNAYEEGIKNYKVYVYEGQFYIDDGINKYIYEINEIPMDLLNYILDISNAAEISSTTFEMENSEYSTVEKSQQGEKLSFNNSVSKNDSGLNLYGKFNVEYKSHTLQKYLITAERYENNILTFGTTMSVESKGVAIKTPLVSLYKEYQG